MDSGPLVQPLFYQYRSTSEPGEPFYCNASQRIAAIDLVRAKEQLLATNLRHLNGSAAQPRAA